MTKYERFACDDCEGITIVRLRDSEILDRARFVELADELLHFSALAQPQFMIVSFEYVRRFSSEAISVLLRLREQMLGHGGQLVLCEMRNEIFGMFSLLGLDFLHYPTVTQSLDHARHVTATTNNKYLAKNRISFYEFRSR